ncbi:MAG: sel1 repeat family protein [Kordiimonadaceae bacterium]|nr:sel1 repeat family protein [Kordiimonadaceae bacterium]
MKKLLLSTLFLLLNSAAYAQDYSALFNKMTEMAQSGDGEAAYHLGNFYNYGVGTEINKEEAFKWFQKSAEAKNPLGAYELGYFYTGQEGEIADAEPQKAFQNMKFAADRGYAAAQYNLAIMYYNFGNPERGTYYLELAAKQGNLQALQTMALINFRGDMVEQNFVNARTYLKLFLKDNNPELNETFQPIITQIEEILTEDQIKTSDERIVAWKNEPSDLTTLAEGGLNRSFEYAGLPQPQ